MPEWDEGKRKQALSDWSTRNVNLHSPVPVHIVYATAWRDHDGTVQFREDIYDSDAELARDLAKPRPQVAIITTPGRVAHRRSVHAEDGTRPTLADAEQLPSMLDSLPLSGGLHQFFPATSFSTALLSMASASSRLSRPFSSSSTFSLRACDKIGRAHV